MQQHEVGTIVQGQIIADKYRLEDQIGKGAWATIYRAEHVELKKTFALKVLSLHMVHDAKAISRFETEARVICKLQHPNLVRVYDFGVLPNDQPYFVMEFVAGESMSEMVAAQGPMPWQRAVRLAMQICDGLAHAHEQDVLHRDVKPENVLVAQDDNGADHAYLVDFGLAKVIGADSGNLTRTGETWGTPHYMSPEQCLGERLDERSDIYSLGCLMYEVLTGHLAFDADNAVLLMEQHLKHTPQTINKIHPEGHCPQLLEDTVMSAIQRQKDDRPQTVPAMRLALERCLTGEPWTAALQRHRRQMRKRISKYTAAMVCLALVATTVALCSIAYLRSQKPDEPKWAKQFTWQAPVPLQGASWQSTGSLDANILERDYLKAARQAGAIARTAQYVPETILNADELIAAGETLVELQRPTEAATALQKAMSICREVGADARLPYLHAQCVLSEALAEQGKFAEAEALASSSSGEIAKMLGDDHVQYADALLSVASVQRTEHHLAAAQDSLNRAEEIVARTSLPGDPGLAMIHIDQARLLATLHSTQRAKEIITRELLAAKSPSLKSYLLALLAAIADQDGDDQRAIELYEGSLEAQSQTGKVYAELPDVLRQYAKVLRKKQFTALADRLEKQAGIMNEALSSQPQADLFSN